MEGELHVLAMKISLRPTRGEGGLDMATEAQKDAKALHYTLANMPSRAWAHRKSRADRCAYRGQTMLSAWFIAPLTTVGAKRKRKRDSRASVDHSSWRWLLQECRTNMHSIDAAVAIIVRWEVYSREGSPLPPHLELFRDAERHRHC